MTEPAAVPVGPGSEAAARAVGGVGGIGGGFGSGGVSADSGAAGLPAATRQVFPLGIVVGPTGHPDVDSIVERLSEADGLPTNDHIQVYEDVHRGLRDALTALDDDRS